MVMALGWCWGFAWILVSTPGFDLLLINLWGFVCFPTFLFDPKWTSVWVFWHSISHLRAFGYLEHFLEHSKFLSCASLAVSAIEKLTRHETIKKRGSNIALSLIFENVFWGRINNACFLISICFESYWINTGKTFPICSYISAISTSSRWLSTSNFSTGMMHLIFPLPFLFY